MHSLLLNTAALDAVMENAPYCTRYRLLPEFYQHPCPQLAKGLGLQSMIHQEATPILPLLPLEQEEAIIRRL